MMPYITCLKEAFWISKQFSQLHSTAASLNVLTQQESKTEKTVLQLIINRFIYSEIMIICQQWYEYSIITHMYPAQGDEIILVLYEEEFLLIFGVTIIWPTTLLRYDDVCHRKCISGLQQQNVILFDFKIQQLQKFRQRGETWGWTLAKEAFFQTVIGEKRNFL